ncbi:MAG: GNAT family N-acetyltransferase [Alteromonadaceae bacterium]|nr:GNAT family N-acetyltransferase [Alteromonadaceae bacterium]
MKVEQDSELQAPALKTDNIYLRVAKLSDFPAIKSYRQNVENCRYIRPAENDKKTMEIVENLTKPWKFEQGMWNGLVICLTGEDTVIGEIVFNIENCEDQRAEIGCRISETVAGRGVCTQAAKLLIDYLFTEIGLYKLVAKCDPRKTASYRVMEKLGFKREAFFKGHYLMGDEWTDQYDYGLLASQW